MSSHTIGPWFVFRDEDGKLYVSPWGGPMVAIIVEGDVSVNSDDNADLISAAPDLLSAIMGLLSDTQHSGHECNDEKYCTVLAAKRAIAKANGRDI